VLGLQLRAQEYVLFRQMRLLALETAFRRRLQSRLQSPSDLSVLELSSRLVKTLIRLLDRLTESVPGIHFKRGQWRWVVNHVS
jgi:hypothetical protein